jgi:hypothetical protein
MVQPLPPVTGPNVLAVGVNHSPCAAASYFNKPCVEVTVCTPGTHTCQTLSDILVDTGSSGFRVFRSLLTIEPTPVLANSAALTECLQFVGGASDWGPVSMADIVLGGEPAVTVPIQVIDNTFADANTYCPGATDTPDNAGYSGILGVGLQPNDCGLDCSAGRPDHLYYACTGTTCATVTPPTMGIVRNPVSALPLDNNGIILELPGLPEGGADSAQGYLILGIGTAANNAPQGVRAYAADPESSEFFTEYAGQTLPGFIDSGSNGFYFPGPTGLTPCANTDANAGPFFCPTQPVSITATILSASGSPRDQVTFKISSFLAFQKAQNQVSAELGGNTSGLFDWGLPFFFGRRVFVAMTGAQTPLGMGPYWAY